MASFLVKLDMDRPKKRRRKKNCCEYHFWLLKLEHSQKNSKKVVKKFKKLKMSFWFHFLPNGAMIG